MKEILKKYLKLSKKMYFPNQSNQESTNNSSSTQSRRIVQGVVDLVGIIISFVAFGLVTAFMV